MASRFNQPDNWVLVIRFDTWKIEWRASSFGKDSARGRVGKGRLADTLGASEQPRMVESSQCPGARELLDSTILSGDHGSRSRMASNNRPVTSSGEPEASTSFTRSGSSAAMMWNAASTLR